MDFCCRSDDIRPAALIQDASVLILYASTDRAALQAIVRPRIFKSNQHIDSVLIDTQSEHSIQVHPP